MNIHAINAVKFNNSQKADSQPAFNGYADKSFVKLIDTATQNSIKQLVTEFSQKGKKIQPEQVMHIKTMGENIKRIFSDFMAPFHPQTVLTTDGKRTLIKNNALDTNIDFTYLDNYENSGEIYTGIIDIFDPVYSMPKGTDIFDVSYRRIDLNKLGFEHLKEFNTFAKKLKTLVDPKEVDSKLFDRYTDKLRRDANTTSIVKGISVKLKAKKADKLAPEFGRSVGWVEKVKSIRAEAKKQSAIKKVVTVENKKIAKQILNEQ